MKLNTDKKVERGDSTSADEVEQGMSERFATLMGEKRVSQFASECGIRESLLRKYLAGSIPGADKAAQIAKNLGVCLDWLVTGQGPMRPGEEPQWREGSVRDELDAKLDAAEYKLRQLEVPIDESALNDDSIVEIKQILKDISHASDAAETQRARADMMLNLAFDDEGAQRRGVRRQKDVGAKLRASRKAYEEAIDAIGYEPPPAIAEALKTVLFAHGLDTEGAVILLASLKDHYNKPSEADPSPYAW